LRNDLDEAIEPMALPSLLQVMDLQQEQVTRTLGEGHRVIHGSPGSGKTMILVFRAQFLAATARPARPILVMCFNRAHDFEDAWLRIAARMVAPETHSLLVLYDDAQSIYRTRRGRRRLNFASLGIEARGRTSILRLNYRNTAEVLSLAVACARHLLDGTEGSDDEVPLVAPASAGRRGPLPVLGRADQGPAAAHRRRAAAARAGAAGPARRWVSPLRLAREQHQAHELPRRQGAGVPVGRHRRPAGPAAAQRQRRRRAALAVRGDDALDRAASAQHLRQHAAGGACGGCVGRGGAAFCRGRLRRRPSSARAAASRRPRARATRQSFSCSPNEKKIGSCSTVSRSV
jgi:hypothetical protein